MAETKADQAPETGDCPSELRNCPSLLDCDVDKIEVEEEEHEVADVQCGSGLCLSPLRLSNKEPDTPTRKRIWALSPNGSRRKKPPVNSLICEEQRAQEFADFMEEFWKTWKGGDDQADFPPSQFLRTCGTSEEDSDDARKTHLAYVCSAQAAFRGEEGTTGDVEAAVAQKNDTEDRKPSPTVATVSTCSSPFPGSSMGRTNSSSLLPSLVGDDDPSFNDSNKCDSLWLSDSASYFSKASGDSMDLKKARSKKSKKMQVLPETETNMAGRHKLLIGWAVVVLLCIAVVTPVFLVSSPAAPAPSPLTSSGEKNVTEVDEDVTSQEELLPLSHTSKEGAADADLPSPTPHPTPSPTPQ